MIEHKMIDLNGIRFHYVEAPGPGPTLVLLLGFSDSVESYLPTLPELATIAHVYAFDFRGHGQSGHTPDQYTAQDHVTDTALFLQQVTGTPVILAGHSMGGLVAAWTTARHPDWIKGLIIEDMELIFTSDGDNSPKTPAFIPTRDRIIEFKASGKSLAEFADFEARLPAPPAYGGKTRIEVYGRAGVDRHAKQRWLMDITHIDSLIDGSWLEGYVTEETLSALHCPTC